MMIRDNFQVVSRIFLIYFESLLIIVCAVVHVDFFAHASRAIIQVDGKGGGGERGHGEMKESLSQNVSSFRVS